jgi:hypothetical protein
MTPAVYTFPEIRRGNSIPTFDIATLAYTNGNAPVLLASAALEIRSAARSLLKRYDTASGSATLSAPNTVTLSFTPGSETAAFPVGTHQYDLLVRLQSGESWTVLAGPVRVVAFSAPA